MDQFLVTAEGAFIAASATAEQSESTQRQRLCALLFLCRSTLRRGETVLFIKLPRLYSALPEVLSQNEVE